MSALVVVGVASALTTSVSSQAAARADAGGTAVPVMYQFKVSVHGRLVDDEPNLVSPAYPPGRCEPVTGLKTTLLFKRPASSGSRADLYFVTGRIPGFLPDERANHGHTTATLSAVDSYGPPRPDCTDTAPPLDCSAMPRAQSGLSTTLTLSRPYRHKNYDLQISVDPTTYALPFKTCYFNASSSVEGYGSIGGSRILRDIENPNLRRFTLTRAADRNDSLSWTATFTRIGACNFHGSFAGPLQEACLRGLH